MDKNTSEDKAYLDITISHNNICYIDMFDNGELPAYIASAMVQNDELLSLLAEAYIIYQEKIGTGLARKLKIKTIKWKKRLLTTGRKL